MHQMTFELRNKTFDAVYFDTLLSMRNLKLAPESCEKQEPEQALAQG